MSELVAKGLQKIGLRRLAKTARDALEAERGDIESPQFLMPLKEQLKSGAMKLGLLETAAEEFTNKTLAQAIEDFKNPMRR